MERRVQGNLHARCEGGENLEIISNGYLFPSSDNQIELVKKIIDTSSFESLIAVGDDSQTIFEFRDAVTENIVEFFEKLGKEGQDFYITENHRSTPEILEFANTLIKRNRIRVEKELAPTRASGKAVEVEGFYDKAEELDYIVNVIKEKLDEGYKPEDIAVLAATRAELIKINGALSEAGIETSLQCPEPMLENPRVQGIIAFSRMLADDSATKDILTVENVFRDGGLLEDCDDDELNAIIEKKREAIKAFRELPYNDKIVAFDATIEKLAHGDSVALNMVERLKRLPNVAQKQAYIEEFVRFNGEAVKREGRFSGVVLNTAHSSKGLEWPVIVNSISGYAKKELVAPKAIEGKRRLLFVSSTRARDELYITGQFRVGKDANGEYINNMFLKESYEAIDKEFAPRNASEEKAYQAKIKAKKKAQALAEKMAEEAKDVEQATA